MREFRIFITNGFVCELSQNLNRLVQLSYLKLHSLRNNNVEVILGELFMESCDSYIIFEFLINLSGLIIQI